MTAPLTEQDVQIAVEAFARHVQGDYVRRRVLAAPTLAEAAKIARHEGGTWGSFSAGTRIQGDATGIDVAVLEPSPWEDCMRCRAPFAEWDGGDGCPNPEPRWAGDTAHSLHPPVTVRAGRLTWRAVAERIRQPALSWG